MRIENWSITGNGPYIAPEQRHQQIAGEVFGHPKIEDGKFIRTSDIEKIDGSKVTTYSGSVYTLGEPKEEYVTWCQEPGCHVPTSEEPIKLC